MSEILFHYKRPDPATWVYLSSFLTIGLFFVFHRFWSIRNLDIVLLLLLAPGLLMVHNGRRDEFQARERKAVAEAELPSDLDLSRLSEQTAALLAAADNSPPNSATPNSSTPNSATPNSAAAEAEAAVLTALQAAEADSTGSDDARSEGLTAIGPELTGALSQRLEAIGAIEGARRLQLRGFVWLLAIQILILLRLLLDAAMVRRPLLAPNLTTGGLFFIGASLAIFLMANVIGSTARQQLEQGPELSRAGYPLMQALPTLPTRTESYESLRPTTVRALPADTLPADTLPAEAAPGRAGAVIARILVIAAHVSVLVGIVLIGYRHFGNLRAGAGCALLYLLLPYTAQMTGRVDHVLPAAMLVWAVLMYRRPLVAGIFLGLAAGLVYYPLFLLPLWISFYWQRGLKRFNFGVLITIGTLMLLLTLGGWEEFGDRLRQMFGLWLPRSQNLEGVWGLGWFAIWRLPVLVAFLLLAGFYSIWPAQKNLGTLISCSASLMVAAQFWHGYGGGLYIAWFLPLLLLTIFRPNLEDRVALKVIGGGSLPSSRRASNSQTEAA
ncbi:hypothetical protein [Roseimaritima sediminicola]|uniref:hypothetical protein n=1 Tax=Roseimaritima sediminicola TaxID=2662066 RepID=UPI00129832DC|nr:hypothetical protein [Roseimaritima sediminicola]